MVGTRDTTVGGPSSDNESMALMQQRILEIFKQFGVDGGGNIERGEFISVVKYLDPTWTDECLANMFNEAGVPKEGIFDFQKVIDWLFAGPSVSALNGIGEGSAAPLPRAEDGPLQRYFLSTSYAQGQPMDTTDTGYTNESSNCVYHHQASGIRVWHDAVELMPENCGPLQVLFHYTNAKIFEGFTEEPVVTEDTWEMLCFGDDCTASGLEPKKIDAEIIAQQKLPLFCIPIILPSTMVGDPVVTAESVPDLRVVKCENPYVLATANLKKHRSHIIQVRKEVLGEKHPVTLAAMNNFAHTLEATGDINEAVAVCRRVHEIFADTKGENHADTLLTQHNLAYLLERAGDLKGAEEQARRSLAGREATLGKEHEDTLTSVYNLAELLEAQGKIIEAEKLFKLELEWCKKTFGARHAHTRESTRNFNRFCQQHDRQSHVPHISSRRFTTVH